MKLQDAIKSGKPFKRRLSKSWHSKMDSGLKLTLPFEDLLADDWIVKAEPIEFVTIVKPSGMIYDARLTELSGKRVQITVEVIE
jgi:hypothetical protein